MPWQDGKELEEFVAANSDVVSAAPDGLEVSFFFLCIDVKPCNRLGNISPFQGSTSFEAANASRTALEHHPGGVPWYCCRRESRWGGVKKSGHKRLINPDA